MLSVLHFEKVWKHVAGNACATGATQVPRHHCQATSAIAESMWSGRTSAMLRMHGLCGLWGFDVVISRVGGLVAALAFQRIKFESTRFDSDLMGAAMLPALSGCAPPKNMI